MNVAVYVAVPEKYFTPSSSDSVQEDSLSSVTEAGAPQPSGKLTVQGPPTLATAANFGLRSSRPGPVPDAALRKTMKRDPRGSSVSRMTVLPSCTVQDAASRMSTVFGSQVSGTLPWREKERVAVTGSSAVFATNQYSVPSSSMRWIHCTRALSVSRVGSLEV